MKRPSIRLISLLGINILCFMVIIACSIMLLRPGQFWKKLDFEYVGESNFEYNENYS